MQQKLSSTLQAHPYDEAILVIKRSKLFEYALWNGLKKDSMDEYVQLIFDHKEFHPRSIMEEDPTYKQIIPYLVFRHNNRYFLMQRQATASEQRLKNKYSLGIGGHVRQEDITHNSLFSWARREFYEEVSYEGILKITPLGILNDDSTNVGKVHLGLVLLLEGSTDAISIKSELKSGTLYTLEQCHTFFDSMETWSQIVYKSLNA